MANSADVVAGNDAKASEYNNLRADVLNTSSGHTHDGSDSRGLSTSVVLTGWATRHRSLSAFHGTHDPVSSEDYTLTYGAIENTAVANVIFWYPIELPNGAKLRYVRVYFNINAVLGSGVITVYKADLTGVTQTSIGTGTTSGQGGQSVTTGDIATIIDNTSEHYYIAISTGADEAGSMKSYSIRIQFDVQTPLP